MGFGFMVQAILIFWDPRVNSSRQSVLNRGFKKSNFLIPHASTRNQQLALEKGSKSYIATKVMNKKLAKTLKIV